MTIELALIGAVLVLVLVVLLRDRGSQSALRDDVLADRVSALTSEAVKGMTGELLEQNREAREADRLTAEKELEERTSRFEQLAKPMEQGIRDLNARVESLDKERAESLVETRTLFQQSSDQIRQLSKEAANLNSALRKPQVRGSWGESQLKRCFELAGMAEHVDFVLQETIDTPDGQRRPDATVQLPQDRSVVVDSKVPLEPFMDALNAEDEASRQTALTRLASGIRGHVKLLASKEYHRQFGEDEKPDFVVCFIRADSALQAAWDADPGLFDYAIEKRVLIASPTFLIGLLRTIELGWRQEKVAEDAIKIAGITRRLHDRFGKFLELFSKLGRSITSVATDYEKAGRSIETRLMPQLRRAEELGAGSGRELEAPERMEQKIHELPAPGHDEDAEADAA